MERVRTTKALDPCYCKVLEYKFGMVWNRTELYCGGGGVHHFC
ncbi:uncharacterized protein METZ01_LOCUS461784 [marine metagenome]|uniref:Uncharacterized protein n=1 Tax=marine metagenome TaxID=408172 RepID=A0A383AMZ1_9ZZZZ